MAFLSIAPKSNISSFSRGGFVVMSQERTEALADSDLDGTTLQTLKS